MKKTRLIALIDFSLYSHALIELASRWCEIANAELLLVHSTPVLVPAMASQNTKDEVFESEKKEIISKLSKLTGEKVPSAVKVDYLVTNKDLLDILPEIVNQNDYNDFLLVGVKGTGMLKKILIGSTATKIIEELNYPTIALPSKLCATQDNKCNLLPEKLIVALSYKFPLNEAAFANFLTTYKGSIKKVEFMSVIQSDETEEMAGQYLNTLSEKYKNQVPVSYKIFNGKDVYNEIKEYVSREKDTLLVVQKGSRSLKDQLFREFLINRIVHDGSMPLVIIPQ
ncbi:MAG TPA: universal stress protein [Cytophagaceae bacterium]